MVFNFNINDRSNAFRRRVGLSCAGGRDLTHEDIAAGILLSLVGEILRQNFWALSRVNVAGNLT
jgi:hypothetical protein